MAIDADRAEQALEDLYADFDGLEKVYRNARAAEKMLQHEEALLIKGMDNTKLAANLKQAYARADDRWKKRADDDVDAYAKLKVKEAKREADKLAISLYQSMVKDRL